MAVAKGYYKIEEIERELSPFIVMQILQGGNNREKLAAAKVLVQMRKLAVDQLGTIEGDKLHISTTEKIKIRIEYSETKT